MGLLSDSLDRPDALDPQVQSHQHLLLCLSQHWALTCVVALLSWLPPLLLVPVTANFEYEAMWLVSLLYLPASPLCRQVWTYVWPTHQENLSHSLGVWLSAACALLSHAICMGILFVWTDCACSPRGAWFWWVLMCVPHILLGHALAQFMAAVNLRLGASWSRMWWALLSTLAVWLGLSLFWLWSLPQKRLVDPIWNFVHGPIYDALILVDSGVVWARLGHGVLALFILSLAVGMRKTLSARAQKTTGCLALFLALLGLGCEVLSRTQASRQFGLEALSRALPEKRSAEGYTLHFSRPEGGVDAAKDSVEKAALWSRQVSFFEAQVRFHVSDLKSLYPQGSFPHVHVFVYPDVYTKKRLFGGLYTDIADVFTPSIHITWPRRGGLHGTLRHELVHALFSRYGFWGLGFHPNMAMTEGLAEALAPRVRRLSLDHSARFLLESGKLEGVEQLFGPSFWRYAGGRAYTVAGSFFAWLMQQHGLPKLLLVYQGYSWEHSFGASRKSLVDRWLSDLKSLSITQAERLQAEALYRYPGVLHDRCPHTRADYRERFSSKHSHSGGGSAADGSQRRLALGGLDSHFGVDWRRPEGWQPEVDALVWESEVSAHHLGSDDRGTRWRMLRRQFQGDPDLASLSQSLQEFRRWPPEHLEDFYASFLLWDVLRLVEQQGLDDPSSADEVRLSLRQRLSSYPRVSSVQLGFWLRQTLQERGGWPAVAAYMQKRYRLSPSLFDPPTDLLRECVGEDLQAACTLTTRHVAAALALGQGQWQGQWSDVNGKEEQSEANRCTTLNLEDLRADFDRVLGVEAGAVALQSVLRSWRKHALQQGAYPWSLLATRQLISLDEELKNDASAFRIQLRLLESVLSRTSTNTLDQSKR